MNQEGAGEELQKRGSRISGKQSINIYEKNNNFHPAMLSLYDAKSG